MTGKGERRRCSRCGEDEQQLCDCAVEGDSCPFCNHGAHRDVPCASGGYGNQCPCRYQKTLAAAGERISEAKAPFRAALNAERDRFVRFLERIGKALTFGKARP